MTDYDYEKLLRADKRSLMAFGSQSSWLCPHCEQHATIRDEDFAKGSIVSKTKPRKKWSATVVFITCPNEDCGKVTLLCDLFYLFIFKTGCPLQADQIKFWQLFPPPNAKQFPSFVPKSIRVDYAEACSIRDLSPKSAATLARRCLQTMIRDFWQVKEANLAQEIAAIKPQVGAVTWKAIDAVRKLGNIGAHMEKEVDHVIDITPHEAKKLVWLVGILITRWYVESAEEKKQFAKITKIARQKEAQRKGGENGNPAKSAD